jgi:hypothetical protein
VSLEVRIVGSQALLSIAAAVLSTLDKAAPKKALRLIGQACSTAVLPHHIQGRAHVLRSKCFIREGSLRAAATELSKAAKSFEAVSDYGGLVEATHALALVCNSLGWLRLRDDACRQWKHATTMRSTPPAVITTDK